MMKRHHLLFFFSLIGIFLSSGVAADDQNPNGSHTVVSPDGRYLLSVFHTEDKTWVKAQDVPNANVISQWQIPDFRPLTIEFSEKDSSRLLLADDSRILVFQIPVKAGAPVFSRSVEQGQRFISPTFSVDGESVLWATERIIARSSVESKIERKLVTVNNNRGQIKNIVPVGNDRYIVILENDTIIYVHSRLNTIIAEELKGHQRSVYSAVTPDMKTLYSVDSGQELIIWDLATYEILNRLPLGNIENPSQLEAVSLNDRNTALLVKTRTDERGYAAQYLISDLAKGIVNPSRVSVSATDAGNIYSSALAFSPNSIGEEPSRETSVASLPDSFTAPERQPRKKGAGTSYYELAKIEADNENYEAALDFIKKVSRDDPEEYRQSRELRKKVLREIETRNSLEGAVDQYKSGNYETAKIILENILAKDPDHKTAKRYLKLTEDKMSPQWLSVIGALSLVLLLLVGSGVAVWKFKPSLLWALIPAKKGRKRPSGAAAEPEPVEEKPIEDKAYNLRKAFILKLNETRRILKKAITLDKDGKYKDKWLELSTMINEIEKKAKLNDKYLKSLSGKLEKVQDKVLKLAPAARPSRQKPNGKTDSGKKAFPGAKAEQKKKVGIDGAQKKNPSDPFQILGISPTTSLDDIKKAYRAKMKEYHPDRHESSDFKWVKEEADRMTRLVQNAYNSILKNQINN